jgi:hypothetical protein
MWLNALMSTETDQPHLIEEVVIEGHPHAWDVTDSPRPLRTEGRGMSQLRIDPTLDQCCLASAIDLPLFPLEAPQTMAYPAVSVSQHLGRLAKAKVTLPPSQICRQGGDDLFQASALVAPGQLFDPSFKMR